MPEAEISAGLTGATVRHVRNVVGEAGVEALLRAAGEDRSAAELEDEATWSSYQQAVALLEAAAEVTGDAAVARAIGDETLRQYESTGVAAALRSLGSGRAVLENVAEAAAKLSLVSSFEAVELGEHHALIEVRALGGRGRHPRMCQYTLGVLSQVTCLFGLPPAIVAHGECQAAGASRCLYEVRWDPDSAELSRDPERRADALQAQLVATNRRLDALYTVAADLVSADSVSSVLARLTSRAGSAVNAPGYVLAVRVPTSSHPEVHHHGLDEAAAAEIAGRLLDPAAELPPSWLVAEVASPQHRYGRLAAVSRAGVQFLSTEGRLLDVYARFAAAVLDTATALETARERDATARALLDLATALSRLDSRTEVAERLAATVPALVGLEQAVVLEWDAAAGMLRGVASHGLAPAAACRVRGLAVDRADTALLDRLLADPRPRVVSCATADPFLAATLHQLGLASMTVIPLRAHGAFHGVLAAGSAGASPDYGDELLVERLCGLANQGAMAFGNAVLLDEARHQAMHDPLTGLANRRLLEEAAEKAIATAGRTGDDVALLFIDLDGFKAVNDERGHLAGDELLRHVARSLEATVRSEDTVARVSGDEFAVLLPRVVDREQADTVAHKLLDAVRAPLPVDDGELAVTASIGVALAPSEATSYSELLHRADTAMYVAKSARRRSP